MLFRILILSFVVRAYGNSGDSMDCPSQSKPDTCQLLGPTHWYIGVDSANQGAKLFQPLAKAMFENCFRGKKRGHRSTVFASFENSLQYLRKCQDNSESPTLNFDARSATYAKNVDSMFEEIDLRMRSCDENNYQNIVIMFIYGYSPDKTAANHLLTVWKGSRVRSTQVYIIYGGDSYVKNNIYEQWTKTDFIHGSYYYSNPGSEKAVREKAAHLINCICAKSEDCHLNSTVEQKMTKCHFVLQNGKEKCMATFGAMVIFRPLKPRRQAAITCFQSSRYCNESDFQECMADCELKQWSEWSSCTIQPNDNTYVKERRRKPNNQSLGVFTNKSCPEYQIAICPTTTPPSTALVHIIDASTQVPTDFSNIYMTIILGCIGLAVLSVFILICILIHNKSDGKRSTVAATPKFTGKNVMPSTSLTNPSRPSSGEGSQIYGYSHDPFEFGSRSKSTHSRKVSLPTRSQDRLSVKQRTKKSKGKSKGKQFRKRSSVDISLTRKIKRKSAQN